MAPPRPADVTKQRFHQLNLSTAKAAKCLGVSRQQMHRVVTGKSKISPEMALRFEFVIGGTVEQWLTLQSNYVLYQLRRTAKLV